MSDAPAKARLVVVDDEPLILEAWRESLTPRYDVRLFSDPKAAAQHFGVADVDVALIDMRMPNMDGLELLGRLKMLRPMAEAIIVTGQGTIQTAVAAIKLGAYDFLCKPVDDLDTALRRIDAALERKRLREQSSRLQTSLDAYLPECRLLGDSRAMQRVRDLILQVADSPAPVIVVGESGTGKELAARALHSQSRRKDRAFVAINCAAIPETLIDSELFGHEKGAFTGATASHRGLFEAANGGTLFLDEIGDIPLQTQVRLLRALQDGEVRAVGATESRAVDVRVVAATHVDLERAIRDRRFREDFYYRISTFKIELPPLRARPEDVPMLAHHLLAKAAGRDNRTTASFSADALQALCDYDWPGNVRQLANAVEHAATLAGGNPIEPAHLPPFVTTRPASRATLRASDAGATAMLPFAAARDQLLADFERRYLSDLLTATDGNLSEAARRSGIDRSNLRRLLQRHRLSATRFKADG